MPGLGFGLGLNVLRQILGGGPMNVPAPFPTVPLFTTVPSISPTSGQAEGAPAFTTAPSISPNSGAAQ